VRDQLQGEEASSQPSFVSFCANPVRCALQRNATAVSPEHAAIDRAFLVFDAAPSQ
jgi:hypothetical protein